MAMLVSGINLSCNNNNSNSNNSPIPNGATKIPKYARPSIKTDAGIKTDQWRFVNTAEEKN